MWVREPRKAPHRCRRSGRDTIADGPYFEDSLPYCEAPGDDRELTQYISVGWLKTIADAPGSPIAVIDRAELDALRFKLADLAEQRDELQRLLEEQGKPEVVVSPVDEQALASALIVSLEGHFAKKAGRKPQTPSAA